MFTATGQRVSNSAEIDTLFQSQIQRVRTQVEDCMNDSLRLCEAASTATDSAWGGEGVAGHKRRGTDRPQVALVPVPRCGKRGVHRPL